jgi:hypothetical protein
MGIWNSQEKMKGNLECVVFGTDTNVRQLYTVKYSNLSIGDISETGKCIGKVDYSETQPIPIRIPRACPVQKVSKSIFHVRIPNPLTMS